MEFIGRSSNRDARKMQKDLKRLLSAVSRAASIIKLDSKRSPARHTISQRAEEVITLIEIIKQRIERGNHER